MRSKKALVINGINAMKISILEILLDDSKTYQGAMKVIFLKKLG
jgi:hypothetical protein